MPDKIKATVITGFFGAGKTTFINNLIKKYPKTLFALVENEFGEVAIDTQLIKGIDAGRMFELKNGCICCTISNEYELVLLELAERFPNIEYLIIETTGVVDPIPVIRPFLGDSEIQKFYEYNGTICLVDGINFKNQSAQEISIKQIAVADLVLVNKSEHITEIEKENLTKEILSANPLCEFQFITFGNAEKVGLFSILKTDIEKSLPSVSDCSHFNLNIKTIVLPTPVKKEKFLEWFSYNLDIYKLKIFRVKGILYFENDPFRYVLQAVGGNFELYDDGVYLGENITSIVFIGELEGIKLEL